MTAKKPSASYTVAAKCLNYEEYVLYIRYAQHFERDTMSRMIHRAMHYFIAHHPLEALPEVPPKENKQGRV
jgi:hypothetical protein